MPSPPPRNNHAAPHSRTRFSQISSVQRAKKICANHGPRGADKDKLSTVPRYTLGSHMRYGSFLSKQNTRCLGDQRRAISPNKSAFACVYCATRCSPIPLPPSLHQCSELRMPRLFLRVTPIVSPALFPSAAPLQKSDNSSLFAALTMKTLPMSVLTLPRGTPPPQIPQAPPVHRPPCPPTKHRCKPYLRDSMLPLRDPWRQGRPASALHGMMGGNPPRGPHPLESAQAGFPRVGSR